MIKINLKHFFATTILAVGALGASTTIATAGECTSSFAPQYVRMAEDGVWRNDWRNEKFIELLNWNDVGRLYGVSVSYAQGNTCGCTQYVGDPPKHKNSTCQRALNAGLR